MDAVVIGAGLIGLATALDLQRAGRQVTLVDPHADPRFASWGNAGHIAVEQVEPLASFATVKSLPKRLFWRGGALGLPLRDIRAWLPFSLRLLVAALPGRFAKGKRALTSILAEALPAWRRLTQAADATELLVEDGHFIVWESDRSAAAGRAHWLSADTGTATCREATAAELAEIARATSARLMGGVRCIGSGQIADLGQLAEALRRAFEAAGGTRLTASVTALKADHNVATALLSDGRTIAAEAFVVTSGVGSGALLEPVGHNVPIIAERGYHIQSAETGWPQGLPPVVFEDRSMIVTRFRSGLRAASFVEFGRQASAPDPAKFARLRAHVAALGLPFAQPGVEWMGARPTLPDYLPAIGKSSVANNLYYAFGHQHLGLTLAAVTGEAVTALVTGAEPAIDLTPFSIGRFGGMA